jgi:diphosphomevalonate decarboxylase
MVVAIVDDGRPKSISSRDAMDHCADTSPLYRGWLSSVPGDIGAARAAIAARDLDALGQVAEHSALAMHAAAIASRPPVMYFRPSTLAILERVRALRQGGMSAYFTIDAGPHVKILTVADQANQIAEEMSAIAGVSRVITSAVGGPAELVDEP